MRAFLLSIALIAALCLMMLFWQGAAFWLALTIIVGNIIAVVVFLGYLGWKALHV